MVAGSRLRRLAVGFTFTLGHPVAGSVAEAAGAHPAHCP